MKQEPFRSDRRAAQVAIRRLQMNLQGTADPADLDIEGSAPMARVRPLEESRLEWFEPVKDETAFLRRRP